MSDGTINFPNRSTAPATPTTGRTKFWVDSVTKVPFYTDDLGVSKSIAAETPPIRLSYNNQTSTTSGTYEALAYFGFDGTDELGTVTAIKAIVKRAGGTSGSIRIYDETNSLVIAELTGFTETVETIKDLGTISNLPTGAAIWSVQMLRTGGGSNSANVHFVKIAF